MCVRETTFEDESYKKTTNKRLSPRKIRRFHTLNSKFVVVVGLITLSVVIPNKRKRKRVQPERREHALTRIINTKERVDRDSLYICNNCTYLIIIIISILTKMIMMMLRV